MISTGIHYHHILFYIKILRVVELFHKVGRVHSKKRLLQVLAGSKADRPPFWFMRQAGRYLPEYQEVRKQAGDFLNLCYSPDLACEATFQPVRRFTPDAAILFSDILVIPDALGQKVEYLEGTGPVLERLVQASDLDGLEIGRIHDHLAPVYDTVTRLAKALPDDVALIGFAGAPTKKRARSIAPKVATSRANLVMESGGGGGTTASSISLARSCPFRAATTASVALYDACCC